MTASTYIEVTAREAELVQQPEFVLVRVRLSEDELCPFGVPGDVVGFREPFYIDHLRVINNDDGWRDDATRRNEYLESTYYLADATKPGKPCCQLIPECCCIEVGEPEWLDSSVMPDWAVRSFGVLVDVQCKRVWDVTLGEAELCGFEICPGHMMDDTVLPDFATTFFETRWDVDNPNHEFDSNPYVWVGRFAKHSEAKGESRG